MEDPMLTTIAPGLYFRRSSLNNLVGIGTIILSFTCYWATNGESMTPVSCPYTEEEAATKKVAALQRHANAAALAATAAAKAIDATIDSASVIKPPFDSGFATGIKIPFPPNDDAHMT
ncbi:Cysteate synthase [Folsomia candida]|uniref:Cysteate synthase n=1 Tax=Folsomia candida TaxID=158441 RepID=A0A226EKS5_FOLCA|nr:Cysteate synthase [Folsomia candida]